MPIQFPGDLVVAHGSKIKKRNFEPWVQRGALAVHGIEVPVDVFEIYIFEIHTIKTGMAGYKSKVKIFISQQAKTMAADLISLAKDFISFVRKMLTQ